MAEDDDFKYAYDQRTGEKLPNMVPVSVLNAFPDILTTTPLQEKTDRVQELPAFAQAPRVPGKPARTTEGDSNAQVTG